MERFENWKSLYCSDGVQYYDIRNESGRFLRNETGQLMSFEPADENRIYQGPFGYRKGGVCHMRVPEGITCIGTDSDDPAWWRYQDFRDMTVVERLSLPKSLKVIGRDVFSGSLIMDLELPDTLREIGAGAMMCCYIHVLRIPPHMPLPSYVCGWEEEKEAEENTVRVYGRQFKETIINTLIVPKDYPWRGLLPEAKINRILYI